MVFTLQGSAVAELGCSQQRRVAQLAAERARRWVPPSRAKPAHRTNWRCQARVPCCNTKGGRASCPCAGRRGRASCGRRQQGGSAGRGPRWRSGGEVMIRHARQGVLGRVGQSYPRGPGLANGNDTLNATKRATKGVPSHTCLRGSTGGEGRVASEAIRCVPRHQAAAVRRVCRRAATPRTLPGWQGRRGRVRRRAAVHGYTPALPHAPRARLRRRSRPSEPALRSRGGALRPAAPPWISA